MNMKKLIAGLAVLAIAGTASAGMRDRDFDVSVVGVYTSTVSYVLRGELEGIYIDVAAGSTQTVALASEEQTLYSKAGITDDVWVPLRYELYRSTGAAVVSTNSMLGKAPLAGLVTLTVTGADGLADTNATSVTVIYRD